MFADGLYRVVNTEYFKPDARGNIRVRLWFSHDHKARWPVWGVGPDKESATANAIEKFMAQRWIDAGKTAAVVAYGEAVVAKEAKRRAKWAGRRAVPLAYAPKEMQQEVRRKKNPR